ncbi:DMXL1 protein, partial [Polypterus senegalus]
MRQSVASVLSVLRNLPSQNDEMKLDTSANRNCIAVASAHDIQELDISAILATQILTWADDEVDMENKTWWSSSPLVPPSGFGKCCSFLFESFPQCPWMLSKLHLLTFTCHESGATVITYAPKNQLLISGGRKGFICIFDLRLRQLQKTFQAHDSPVKAVAVDPTERHFITGSAEGNMKDTCKPRHSDSLLKSLESPDQSLHCLCKDHSISSKVKISESFFTNRCPTATAQHPVHASIEERRSKNTLLMNVRIS